MWKEPSFQPAVEEIRSLHYLQCQSANFLSVSLYKLANLWQKIYFHFIPFLCFFGEKMHPKQCGHKQCSWESAMGNWANRRSEEEGRNGCDARTRQLCPSYFWAQTEQQLAGMCPCLWSHRTAFAIYSQTQAQRFYISYHAENYLPLCLFQVSKHWLVNLNY